MKSRCTLSSILLFTLLAIFTSCASTKNLQKKYPVHITNTRVIDLLLPENFGHSVDSLFMLTGSYKKSSFYIQALMQSDEKGIFISLLNDFGLEMGSMIYTGDELLFESEIFPKSLKAQYIIIDIQLAFYNADAISTMLKNAGLEFIVEKSSGTEVRKIMNGKKCIEEITKSGSSVKITNHLRGYEYNLSEAQP